MKPFNHINAKTLEEASAVMAKGGSAVAGGTDLIPMLKDNILPDYPQTVVNLKSIAGLDYIREENGELYLGAMTRLADIAEHPAILERYTALAQAAKAVATPHIRDMGTIGGTLAQLPRCWYYRKPELRFNCLRKSGTECFAVSGDNRYHSIFGGRKVHATPCTMECPAGTDIPGYLALIRAGDWDGAARLVLKVNPMPVITARVCAHFCQSGCNRCHMDEAVLNGGVERALGDYIMKNAGSFYAPPEAESGKSVAVVGSGPAGLSAAYYLRRAGNRVTVLEKMPEPGGMLMYAIPAYRLPKYIVRNYIEALRGMGIEFRCGVTVGETVAPEALERDYDSVFYATGAWKRPVVGIAGEELTVFGLDFLVQVHKWMAGKVGSEVFVMGGGNVAMDVAVTAKRLGAKKVTMACLEPRDRMPASTEEIARAEAEGVEIMPSWGLSRVVEENGVVKGMELKRCVSPWNAEGRFDPSYDEDVKTVVAAENILMAIGQSVDLSFLDEKYQLQLRRGLIDVADDTQMTSRPGVFAGGDATTGPGTTIKAVANGRRGAMGMNKYLGVQAVKEPESTKRLTFDADGIQAKTALRLRELPKEQRCLDREDSMSPTMEEAAREAARCHNCGCYSVHPSDVAPALIALNASVVTTRRTISAQELFSVEGEGSTVLSPGEIITEIRVPAPPEGAKSGFIKFAQRKSIDFPVVNCAVLIGVDNPRVCLNAVAPVPYRAHSAEEYLKGKTVDEAVAEAAGAASVEGANPFEATRYKVQIAKTMVKRLLLSLR